MTNPNDVKFSKVDPKTGTVVEFKGPGGAKVAYDGPHATPGPGHNSSHVGYQSAGKRTQGGTQRATSRTQDLSTQAAPLRSLRVTWSPTSMHEIETWITEAAATLGIPLRRQVPEVGSQVVRNARTIFVEDNPRVWWLALKLPFNRSPPTR